MWHVERVRFQAWCGFLDPAWSRFAASMVQNREMIIHGMWSTIAHLIWLFYLMAVVRSVCGRFVFFASEISPRELLLSILTLLNTFLIFTAISATETLWEEFMPSPPMESSFKMSPFSVRRIDWLDWAGFMHLPAGLWSALWSIVFIPCGLLEGCKSQVVLILTVFVMNAARLNPEDSSLWGVLIVDWTIDSWCSFECQQGGHMFFAYWKFVEVILLGWVFFGLRVDLLFDNLNLGKHFFEIAFCSRRLLVFYFPVQNSSGREF